MLSLDKCYDEPTLRKWFEKFEGDVLVSPKVDGVALSIRYRGGSLVLASTRGDGRHGEVVTENARGIHGIPSRVDADAIEVRGEAYIPLSVFRARFAGQYANPRNLTAGGIKAKEPHVAAGYDIHFLAYDLVGFAGGTEREKFQRLRALGFEAVETRLVGEGDLQVAYDELLAKRGELDYETDGVVFRANRLDEQRRLGSTGHHPRHSIAYKFQGDSGTSVLRQVEWSVSRTGAINPVGIVDPVELSGAVVTRVSLHNLSIMAALGGADGVLYLGSEVVMMRRGGVIPNLEYVVAQGSEPVEIPVACPSCGGATFRDADVLYAEHAEGCRAFKVKEFEHFISVIRADGFGEKIVAGLYDAGKLRGPADLFRLKEEDLLVLDRMGPTLAKRLVGSAKSARAMPAEVFLRSLGVDELGKHVSRLLVEEFGDLARIRTLTEGELVSLHTVGEQIAHSVTAGLSRKAEVIDELLEFVELSWPGEVAQPEAPADSPLLGKSVLFTGAMESMTRGAAQAVAVAMGAKAASGVSRTLDFLVLGDKDVPRFEAGWRSSKLRTAEKLMLGGAGLTIISEREFLGLAGMDGHGE
jgi:DNA ligase (NAD+)